MLAVLLLTAGCAERSDTPLGPGHDGYAGAGKPACEYGTNCGGGTNPNDPNSTAPERHTISGQLVVEVDGGDASEINAIWGTRTLAHIEGTDFVLLAAPEGESVSDLVDELAGIGGVSEAEPHYKAETPEANQGAVAFYEGDAIIEDVVDQDAMSRIGLPQAQEDFDGSGVVVAIVDTGIDFTHPELAPFVSSIGYDFVDNDADPLDQLEGLDRDADGLVDEAAGHGTHIAGIVHAIAPSATLMAVRVLNAEGFGTATDVARGIRFAADNGADVINLSFGMSKNSAVIRDAVRYAEREKEVFLAASAGNSGISVDSHFPAKYREVFAVAATDVDDQKASFSNFGRYVDIAAPGVGILSTYLHHGFASWSGTSMSTPIVAGAAALYLDRRPGSDPERIRDKLEDTARRINYWGQPHAGMLGEGRIDVEELVD
jgi:subtilisin family serine protease